MSSNIRSYEVTLIMRPFDEDPQDNDTLEKAWPDCQCGQMVEAINKIIESYYGGACVRETYEGLKKLPYPIEGHTIGIYVFLEIAFPEDKIKELGHILETTTTDVLRFLIVKNSR